MRVIAIAVVGTNNVIGDGHDQPFKFREDWDRFKAVTMGHPIFMGRHTQDAIGRYLPGRTTIVVSRDPEQVQLSTSDSAPSFAVGSVEMALEVAEALDDMCFVCGGGQVYRAAWDHLTELDLTEVPQTAEGSITFPDVADDEWRLLSREQRPEFAFTRRFPILTTDRLTLVPVGPLDLDDWARLYTAPDLPEVPIERHQAGIAANVEHWLSDGLGYWLVRDSLHDRPIGVGGVRRSKELPDGVWSLYYRFAPEAQGQGYAEEMARAGIGALQLIEREAELRASVRPENLASVAVATSLGLTLVDEHVDGAGRALQIFQGKVADLA